MKKKNIVIDLQLWSILAAGLIGLKTKETVYIISASIFLGVLLYNWFRPIKTSADSMNGIQRICIILSLIIPVLAVNTWGDLKLLYGKENIVSFDKLVATSELKPHRFIFAYDNTGADYLLDTLSKIGVIHSFIDYCDAINKYTAWQSKDVIFNKKKDYKNLLIARLCYDLILLEKNKNRENYFQFLKIGDYSEGCNFCTSEWKVVNEKEVTNILKNFYLYGNEDKVEQRTYFNTFYEKIKDITDDDDYLYTLFIYSDFVHDVNNKRKLEGDTSKIRDFQKILNKKKNLIQNIFYIPIKKPLKAVESYMLPNSGEKIQFFNIDKLDEKIPNKVHVIPKNLYFYLSDKSNYVVLLQFEKMNNNEEYHIYKKDNTKDLAIWDGEIRYDNSQNEIRDKTIKLIWDKKPDSNPTPTLEITHKGVHYLVSCEFLSINPNWKIAAPIGCILIGILMAGVISVVVKNIKNNYT